MNKTYPRMVGESVAVAVSGNSTGHRRSPSRLSAFRTASRRSRLKPEPSWRSVKTGGGLFGGEVGGGTSSLSTTTTTATRSSRHRPAATSTRKTPIAYRTGLEPDLLPYQIRGLATPYGVRSRDYKQTQIGVHAFDRALKKIKLGAANCKLLMDHKPESLVADVYSGTLSVYSLLADGAPSLTGLGFIARLPDQPWARRLARDVYRGDVQCSIGYLERDKASTLMGENLYSGELDEISLLRDPAFSQTWSRIEFLTDRDTCLGKLLLG